MAFSRILFALISVLFLALEATDEDYPKMETVDSMTKTKLTIQMLIKDLMTVRKIATINQSQLYGTYN